MDPEAESTTEQAQAPPYNGPCFYLGDARGERPCRTCRGNVRLKVYGCHHEAHEETTIRECQRCVDYEVQLSREVIGNWAVAVTTAPRRVSTLATTLDSLAAAGWEDPHLFAEPGTRIPKRFRGLETIRRRQQMGAWGNWLLALTEIYLSDPHAGAYFLCQDDVVYPRGLREYLEANLWPADRLGVVSLHTPSHHANEDVVGFFPREVGWGAWGAMGFVFPNASVRALLRDPQVMSHRYRGMGNGMQNVDSVVGDWCKRKGLPFYLHSPSLSQHTGEKSTLWKKAGLGGRRSASDFPGEDIDIREVMAEMEIPGGSKADSREADAAPTVGLHEARESGIAAVVIGEPAGPSFESLNVAAIDAQNLSPDEKVFVSPGSKPCEHDDGWLTVPPAGPGFEGALRGALQATRSPWLVILRAGEALDSNFVTDLNQHVRTADTECGAFFLDRSNEEPGGSAKNLPTAFRREALEGLLSSGTAPAGLGALR